MAVIWLRKSADGCSGPGSEDRGCTCHASLDLVRHHETEARIIAIGSFVSRMSEVDDAEN